MEEAEIKLITDFLAYPFPSSLGAKKMQLAYLDSVVASYCKSLLTFGKIQRVRSSPLSRRDLEFLQAQTDEWFVSYRRLLDGVLNVIAKYGS